MLLLLSVYTLLSQSQVSCSMGKNKDLSADVKCAIV